MKFNSIIKFVAIDTHMQMHTKSVPIPMHNLFLLFLTVYIVT